MEYDLTNAKDFETIMTTVERFRKNCGHECVWMNDEHTTKEDALNWACDRGYLDAAKILIENGADETMNNNLALRGACSSGQTNVIKFFIERGLNYRIMDDECICRAANGNHMKLTKFLHKLGANCRAMGDDSFSWSCMYGNVDMSKFLIKNGADIKTNSECSIYYSSKHNHTEIVKILIYHGASMDVVYGMYPLEFARINDNFEMMKFLVDNGAENFLPVHIKNCLSFCEKINLKRQNQAAKKIQSWWIPICYDMNRKSKIDGLSMAERGWKRIEKY